MLGTHHNSPTDDTSNEDLAEVLTNSGFRIYYLPTPSSTTATSVSLDPEGSTQAYSSPEGYKLYKCNKTVVSIENNVMTITWFGDILKNIEPIQLYNGDICKEIVGYGETSVLSLPLDCITSVSYYVTTDYDTKVLETRYL